MESNTQNVHRNDLRELEASVAQYGADALQMQDNNYQTILQEMKQNVIAMKEHEFVHIEEEKTSEKSVVDPTIISDKISQINQFLEFLKMTHLEQDILDYFLRHIMITDHELKFTSKQDPEYVKLKDEVENLEQNVLRSHGESINEIKKGISEKSKDIANRQDQVNEIYLETTNILDECWQMMDELESLQKRQKQNENEIDELNDSDVEVELIKETHKSWSRLRETEVIASRTNEELIQIKSEMDSNLKKGDILTKKTGSLDPEAIKVGSTMSSLIRLWERVGFYGNREEISDLEVYPLSRKFQFKIKKIYTIIMQLIPSGTAVESIQIFEQDGKNVIENMLMKEALELELRNKENFEIYKTIELVIDKILSTMDKTLVNKNDV